MKIFIKVVVLKTALQTTTSSHPSPFPLRVKTCFYMIGLIISSNDVMMSVIKIILQKGLSLIT